MISVFQSMCDAVIERLDRESEEIRPKRHRATTERRRLLSSAFFVSFTLVISVLGSTIFFMDEFNKSYKDHLETRIAELTN